jgi:hypothetical protein
MFRPVELSNLPAKECRRAEAVGLDSAAHSPAAAFPYAKYTNSQLTSWSEGDVSVVVACVLLQRRLYM